MAARKKLDSEIRGSIGDLVLYVDDWIDQSNAIKNAHIELMKVMKAKNNDACCERAINYYNAILNADKFIDNVIKKFSEPQPTYKGSTVKPTPLIVLQGLNDWRDDVFEAKETLKEFLNMNTTLKKSILEKIPELGNEFIDKSKKKVENVESNAESSETNQEVKSESPKP